MRWLDQSDRSVEPFCIDVRPVPVNGQASPVPAKDVGDKDNAMTGTITSDSGRGYFWVEADTTHASYYIHIANVKNRRHLHALDRVKFDIELNPRRRGEMQGVRVEYLGHIMARQTSAKVQP